MLNDFLEQIDTNPDSYFVEFRGFFNVEGGSFELSDQFRDECDECRVSKYSNSFSCSCGRNSRNTIAGSAGDGDGIYTSWDIYDLQASEYMGILAVFDSDYYLANIVRENLENENPTDWDGSLVEKFARTKRVVRGHFDQVENLLLGDSGFHWDTFIPVLDFELFESKDLEVSLFVEEPGAHSGAFANSVEHRPRVLLVLDKKYTQVAGPEDLPSASISWGDEYQKSMSELQACHVETMSETIAPLNVVNALLQVAVEDKDVIEVRKSSSAITAASWALFGDLRDDTDLFSVIEKENWDFTGITAAELLALRGQRIADEEEPPVSSRNAFCENCGKALSETAKFCGGCGQRIPD